MPILIRNIINGDHISFEQFFKLWHKKVYAYFLKKTDKDSLAEELTQRAFIKIWRFRHTLSEIHPIETQLFRIVRTVLLDYFKEAATSKRNLLNYFDTINQYSVEQNHHFDAVQQLNQVLKCLPPMRKQVFILHRLQGYSYKEISERLSISIRSVENHISLALKQLNKYTLLLFISLPTSVIFRFF